MMRNFKIEPSGPFQFIKMDESAKEPAGIRERCTEKFLAEGLKEFNSIHVESVTINDSGEYVGKRVIESDQPVMGIFKEMPKEEHLPSYAEVKLTDKIGNGNVAHILVQLPLVWNGRFAGCNGGGSSTIMPYFMNMFAYSVSWPVMVRNHFACVSTDCAIEPMTDALTNPVWGFKKGTNELDWDHIRYWAYQGTHVAAVVGKKLCELVYGKRPAYSYAQGCSAGGRSCLSEIQRYPKDYNALWVNCAAVPWVRLHLSEGWPYVLMHNTHEVDLAKHQAVYEAILKKYDCEGKDYVDNTYFVEFDPFTMVGIETAAGVITEEDAKTIKMMWEGPSRANGEHMCDGFGPAVKHWLGKLVFDKDGKLAPFQHSLVTVRQILSWVAQNPDLQMVDCTLEDFEKFYDIAMAEFVDLDMQNPDIRPFRDAGGKVIITHSTGDHSVPAITTINYYKELLRYVKSEKELNEFARLFLTHGLSHAVISEVGEQVSFSDTYAALMKWCEDGQAPEELPTVKFSYQTRTPNYTDETVKPFSGE